MTTGDDGPLTRWVAPYASDPAQSRGRQHAERGGTTRGPRDMFQRDRDRIIHSVSFRRLRHKTQVFIAPDGDHYRVRLTHSLEVAQIGRTIARILGLNEDLTEALCLAHDIGHPPFGHAGEDGLRSVLADHGGFDHNAHCLRTLTTIEQPYPDFDGLNLSWEMLEGLAKHNGPVRTPNWAMQAVDAAYPLALDSHASLEAQVAAIADDIAYDNHDMDDGLHAGLITLDQLLEVPMLMRAWDVVRRRYPDAPAERLTRELIRDQIGAMVRDVVDQSRRNIDAARIGHVDDARGAGRPLIAFSDDMARSERAHKRHMYAILYHHPDQAVASERAQRIVADLASAYAEHPERMTGVWGKSCPVSEPERSRFIVDYIAGMTDRFATDRHAELTVCPAP